MLLMPIKKTKRKRCYFRKFKFVFKKTIFGAISLLLILICLINVVFTYPKNSRSSFYTNETSLNPNNLYVNSDIFSPILHEQKTHLIQKRAVHKYQYQAETSNYGQKLFLCEKISVLRNFTNYPCSIEDMEKIEGKELGIILAKTRFYSIWHSFYRWNTNLEDPLETFSEYIYDITPLEGQFYTFNLFLKYSIRLMLRNAISPRNDFNISLVPYYILKLDEFYKFTSKIYQNFINLKGRDYLNSLKNKNPELRIKAQIQILKSFDSLYNTFYCILTNDPFIHTCSPEETVFLQSSINNKITIQIIMLTINSKTTKEIFQETKSTYYNQIFDYFVNKINNKVREIQDSKISYDEVQSIISNTLFGNNTTIKSNKNLNPNMSFFDSRNKKNLNITIYLVNEFDSDIYTNFRITHKLEKNIILFLDIY